jgi:hypothetical protein
LYLRHLLAVIRSRRGGLFLVGRWRGLCKRFALPQRNHDHQYAEYDCQPLPSHLSNSLLRDDDGPPGLKNVVQDLSQPSGTSRTFIKFHKSHFSNATHASGTFPLWLILTRFGACSFALRRRHARDLPARGNWQAPQLEEECLHQNLGQQVIKGIRE